MTTNHPQINSNQPSPQLTFGSIWSETWKIYGKHFFKLTALFFIPMAIAQILPYFLYNLPDPYLEGQFSWPFAISLAIQVLVFFLMILLQYVGYASFFRAVYQVDTISKIALKEAVITALKRIWTYLFLNIRVFVYSLASLFIPLFIVLVMAMAALQVTGSPDATGMNSSKEIITLILSLLMAGVVIAGVIIVSIRMLRSIFAYPMVFAGEKINSKEALQTSIALSKGITWQILGYYIIISLIFFVIILIYMLLAGAIIFSISPDAIDSILMNESQQEKAQFIMELVMLPLSAVMSCFGAVFAYAFMKKAKEVKGLD